MVEKEETIPTIIRQAVKEKRLQLEEEVSRKDKELFVKYYNLLARYGYARVPGATSASGGTYWEIPKEKVKINDNIFIIQVYTEKEWAFHLPREIDMTKELPPLDPLGDPNWEKGPREITVSIIKEKGKKVGELVLNREGKLYGGSLLAPELFLSIIMPRYEELCGFLEKRLSSRKGGGNGGGAGVH